MNVTRLSVVLLWACILILDACGSGSKSPSGVGTGGPTDSGGPTMCAPANSTCTTAEINTYTNCVLSACDGVFTQCYGPDYKSGSYSGPCASYLSCTNACACDDTTCADDCVPSSACSTCSSGEVACLQTCPEPACFRTDGGGGGLVFQGELNLTGAIPVQGSFTDNSSFALLDSCSDFAANGFPDGLFLEVGSWMGPYPGTVAGHDVQWTLEIPAAKFHGPGTYSDSALLFFAALKIDDTVFAGGTTSVTINADGSGSAQVADDPGSPGQTDSGTMTWTCSGG